MDCQECAVGLENSLKRLHGVKSCKVHFISGKAVIVFDEAILSEEEIVAGIRARGFAPSFAKEDLPIGRRYGPHLAVLAVLALFPLLILMDMVLGIRGVGHYIARISRPFFLLILFFGGYPIVKNALFQLFRKNITTDLIITIAMVSALFVGEFSSALLILFFVRLAHFWEEFVVDKSRSAIQQLMDISPKTCRIQRRTGEEIVDIS